MRILVLLLLSTGTLGYKGEVLKALSQTTNVKKTTKQLKKQISKLVTKDLQVVLGTGTSILVNRRLKLKFKGTGYKGHLVCTLVNKQCYVGLSMPLD